MLTESAVDFTGGADVAAALREFDYIADDDLATVVHLATALDRPLLLEGPAGVEATFDFRAAFNATATRMMTAVLKNQQAASEYG